MIVEIPEEESLNSYSSICCNVFAEQQMNEGRAGGDEYAAMRDAALPRKGGMGG